MTNELEATIDRMTQEIQRLNIALTVSGHAVRTENEQATRFSQALLHEQGVNEALELEIVTLKDRCQLYLEHEASDRNEILSLTKERDSALRLNEAYAASIGRAS